MDAGGTVHGRSRRRLGALAAIVMAAGVASLPVVGHPTGVVAAVGDVVIDAGASPAPATVPSDTIFNVTFTAKNISSSATAGPVTLTDHVLDRPAYYPPCTFVACRANGALITGVSSSSGAATCQSASGNVIGVPGWLDTPLMQELNTILLPYQTPILNLVSDGVPGGLPTSAVTAAQDELANPTPGVPGPPVPANPPPVVETAECSVPTLAAGAGFSMTVSIYASLTSASQSAPIVNNLFPPIVAPPLPSQFGLCGSSTAQPARVCRSVPTGRIVNQGQVTPGAADLAGVPSDPTQTHLERVTEVTPAITMRLDPGGTPGAVDGSGAPGTTYVQFPVVLSRPSDSTVTVSYSTADGTALSGIDYTGAAGTVTFAPGERLQVIQIALIDNGAVGLGNLTFSLTLSGPSTTSTVDPTVLIVDKSTGAAVASTSDTATITPDE